MRIVDDFEGDESGPNEGLIALPGGFHDDLDHMTLLNALGTFLPSDGNANGKDYADVTDDSDDVTMYDDNDDDVENEEEDPDSELSDGRCQL